MKRQLQFFWMMLLPLWIWAGPVDVETARQQAAGFFNQHPSSLAKQRRSAAKQQEMQLLYVQQDSPEEAPLLYVFGVENGEGYAVIAGDDAAISPVLGYSKTGSFDPENMPCCLRDWLDEYGQQLSAAREASSMRKAPANNVTKAAIEPLIKSKWGQDAPYNNLCPIYDSNTGWRCPAGCVATAIAQIMYYHQWPIQGVGSHTYQWNGQNLTANFGSTTYEWDKMKDTYELEDNDPDDALATLIYHCGVAVNMSYGINSAASLRKDCFTEYFNYSEASLQFLRGDYDIDPVTMEEIIYDELSDSRPVLITGFPEVYGNICDGHAFVCDGYDNGYFHFNFGWDGRHDDYYLLSAITPYSDSDYNYSFHHDIVYGIQKPGKELLVDGVLYEYYPDKTAILLKGSVVGAYEIPSTIQTEGGECRVIAIKERAFENCSNLTSLVVPDNVKSIGDGAFYNCYKLSSVTLPNSIRFIDNQTFAYCSNLTSIAIPSHVRSIGSNAFNGCGKLETLTIPQSVNFIGWYAFNGCASLTSIIVENGNLKYDSRNNCNALIETATNTLIKGCNNTIIPDGITSIDDYAFYQCSGLNSIVFPSSVTSIGDYAFYGCKQLTDLNIPKNVVSIGSSWGRVFAGCSNLTSIIVEKGNLKYDSRNNCNALIETATNTLIQGCNNTIIPDDITSIGDMAFDNCRGLVSVTIPDGVTSIGDFAFEWCTSLTSINFPTGLKKIGKYAFNACLNISSVVSKTRNIFAFGTDAFNGVNYYSPCVLTVPYGTKDAYIAAGWTENVFKGGIVEAPYALKIADVDGNEKVTITDAVAIVSHILGDDINGFVAAAADVNGDGRITITDAVAVVDMILSGTASAKARRDMEENTLDPK